MLPLFSKYSCVTLACEQYSKFICAQFGNTTRSSLVGQVVRDVHSSHQLQCCLNPQHSPNLQWVILNTQCSSLFECSLNNVNEEIEMCQRSKVIHQRRNGHAQKFKFAELEDPAWASSWPPYARLSLNNAF